MLRLISILIFATVFSPSSLECQASYPGSTVPTLQPGDVIKVEVWREVDLSGEFTVDENGIVTLPLLGTVQVTNIPLPRLRDTLLERYQKELRNPSINIVPLRNVLVLGDVNKPGAYRVDPTTTVLGVIALAEGIASGGSVNRIQVRRGEEIVEQRVKPGASLSALGVRSGDQVFVGSRSWFSRNRSFVVSLLLALPSVVYTITRIKL